MNNSMYSSNSTQAIGFSGLRHYVTDIERALSRCRSSGNSGLREQSTLEHSLVGDLIVDDDSSEPLLVHADPDYLSITSTGEHVYVEEPEHAVMYTAEKSKSSFTPAISSILAIVATGFLTVGLMQYLEQNKVPVASSSLLELVEEAPPIGRGLVLNPAQIRYCIAQGIRLGGASENKSSLSSVSEANLQAMLTDYNNRCAEYRFQAGAFDEARSHVESLRAVLQHEGVAMLASLERSSLQNALAQQGEVPMVGAMSDGGDLASQAMTSQAPLLEDALTEQSDGLAGSVEVFDDSPRKFIKDVQWRLYKLKYYSGPIDGLDSTATQNALRGFFSVHTEAADATEERAIFRAIDKIYEQRH